MKKIPTMFDRDWNAERRPVIDKVTPGCEWVLAGEGVATRKYDGMCCAVIDGRFYKRREVKPGQQTPEGFTPISFDEETQKEVGWVPVGDGPEDKGLRDAWERTFTDDLQRIHVGDIVASTTPDGTYEFLGPKSQGNVERFAVPTLLAHTEAPRLLDAPRTFDDLRIYLDGLGIEGIVWHHPDGRMAKIKARDFGLKR